MEYKPNLYGQSDFSYSSVLEVPKDILGMRTDRRLRGKVEELEERIAP